MSRKDKNNFADLVFISIFSVLVFFGAFFVFGEFQKSKSSKQISVRSLENSINQKVNNRIRKLEGKKIFLKSKIKENARVNEELPSIDTSEQKDSRLEMQIFEKNEIDSFEPEKRSIHDQVLEEASYEDGNSVTQQETIELYKKELIQRAREEGWEIELDDNLEIIKQVRLKK